MVNIKRWLKREKILAMQDADLIKLLITKGKLKSDKDDFLKCNSCHDDIKVSDVAGVKSSGSELYVFCSKLECFEKITNK